jgi:hypothetical protein
MKLRSTINWISHTLYSSNKLPIANLTICYVTEPGDTKEHIIGFNMYDFYQSNTCFSKLVSMDLYPYGISSTLDEKGTEVPLRLKA